MKSQKNVVSILVSTKIFDDFDASLILLGPRLEPLLTYPRLGGVAIPAQVIYLAPTNHLVKFPPPWQPEARTAYCAQIIVYECVSKNVRGSENAPPQCSVFPFTSLAPEVLAPAHVRAYVPCDD